jgi:secondary thiamine-phosphate synthase enzyme
MMHSERFAISTRGNAQVIDITDQVRRAVAGSGLRDGIVCVFVVGSTAAITTTEAEPGLVNHDLAAFCERVAPQDGHYVHEQTWHDDNGHSHVRASLFGPSLSVPLVDGAMPLGTWQQIILMDFDTRARNRDIVVQVVGE